MDIVGIDHVQITVPKSAENDARDFYCTFLGLVELPKPPQLRSRGGFWLKVGPHVVHVGVEDEVDRTRTKAHIAYAVCDLSAWRAKLAERGVTIVDSIPILGYSRFEFRDPFGNRVELIEPN